MFLNQFNIYASKRFKLMRVHGSIILIINKLIIGNSKLIIKKKK